MYSHSRRRLASAALLAATGLVASACVSSTSSTAARTTDETIPLLNWALPYAPASLDYAKNYSNNSTGAIMSLVTEPLEQVSAAGTFTPVLATSVKQPNATTLIYELRSGVKFSDGSALTADDVAWSIQHFTASTAQSSALGQDVSSATVTGPLEVTVKLGAAVPTARTGIDLATLVEEAKFAKAHASTLGNSGVAPIGTGPYKVASETASTVTLVRNAEFTRTKPAPDKVVFTVISDDNARQLALRSGSIAGGPVTDLRAGDEWKAIPGATVYPAQSLSQDFITFDTSNAPFSDVHVRRAIAYSVDRTGIAHAALNDFATPLTSLIPAQELSGVAGSDSAAAAFTASLPQYPLSQSAAKSELAQSAYPNGFTATIQYIADQPWEQLTAESLQQNLKPLGINLTLKSVTSDQWYAQFFQHTLTGINMPSEFSAGAPDPASLLGKLVGSANIGPQKLNIANWSMPAVNQAQAVVAVAGPNAARWQASQTILSAVADQVPYIPLFTEDDVYATGKGFAITGAGLTQFSLSNGTWIYLVKPTTSN